MTLRAVWFLGLIPSFIQASCLPTPISLPLRDVVLANNAKARGISVALGTPAQSLSLLVNAEQNETYVFGSELWCPGSLTSIGCLSWRGGQYFDNSTSIKTAGLEQSRDTLQARVVSDALQLSPNFTLPNFKFAIPSKDIWGGNNGYYSQAQLGLSRNSSLLANLKNAGSIGSRVFSVFWGLVGPTPTSTPGSFVVGGYDQAIAGTSANYTAPLAFNDPSCPTGMLVTINDLVLNFADGTDSSIFPDSKTFPACVMPQFAGLMTVPEVYWQNFMSEAGGDWPKGKELRSSQINYYTMLYNPNKTFDLTISIQNGIKIRVPNKQLVVPEPSIDESGIVQYNASLRNVVLNSLEGVNANDRPILGRLLLSSAYLMVNHDANSFTLWEADTTPGPPALKAVGERGEITEQFCANNTKTTPENPTQSTATAQSSTPSSAPGSNKGLSGGAIGGIVGGLIAGIAIIGAIVIFLKRKRSSDSPYKLTGGGSPIEMGDSSRYSVPVEQASPVSYKHVGPPQEMDIGSDPQELDSRAVPPQEP